ncbi:MAG: hypothetical protein ACO26U_11575 [Burkholderiaceae bacterium]
MPPELALLRRPARVATDPSQHRLARPGPHAMARTEPHSTLESHGLTDEHNTTVDPASLSLIVHSGQRWIQASDRARPLLSRLSNHHPVLFIEPPLHAAVDHPLMQLSEPHPQVVRAVPLLPLRASQEPDAQRGLSAWLLAHLLSPQTDPGFDEPGLEGAPPLRAGEIDGLVVGLPEVHFSDGVEIDGAGGHARALHIARNLAQRFAAPVQWFGTPMEAPVLIGRFGCLGTIYDRACAMLHMDRWNPGFVERDRALLRQADLVLFNGEPALNASRAAYLRHASAQDHDSIMAQALRAAWDAKATLIRTRIVDLFGERRRKTLPTGFLAASAEAFGLQ